MFIILIAHIPNNEFASWIPARFGFSDATEIFVFCSGVASAYAFGPAFDRYGWRWGAKRILRRVWEVYRAHVGVFLTIVAALGTIDHWLPSANYLRGELNLGAFLDDPARLMAHFLTLTYVPNFFDILPMYLLILAMVPLVMAVAQVSKPAVAVLCFVLWLGATVHRLDLPAEPWSDRPWFFSPFAWQAVFFTGFSYARGWLPAPPRRRELVIIAVVILLASAPFSCHYGFSCYAGWGWFPSLGDIHEDLSDLIDKPHFGILRYVHFLAVAYLAFVFAGPNGSNLRAAIWRRFADVGQQTLAVFLSGLVIAQLLGVVLDRVSFPGMQLLANLVGCALLYVVARFMSFWKAGPPGGGRGHSVEPAAEPQPGASKLSRVAGVIGAASLTIAGATSLKASEIRRVEVPSPALQRVLPTSFYLPEAKGPLPVLYLLHGTNGNENDWPVMGHVQETVDGLIQSGAIPPVIVAMPNGGNSWYVDNPDASGAGLVGTALTHDLVTYVDREFHAASCRSARAIGGTSMGGYGALLHAMDHPGLYGAAFGLSAAIWRPWPDDAEARAKRPSRMFRGAYGDPLDPDRFNAQNIFPKLAAYAADPNRPMFRLAVGDRDFSNLREANIEIVEKLAKLGVKVPFEIDPGAHEWSLWATQLPKMLEWLAPQWRHGC